MENILYLSFKIFLKGSKKSIYSLFGIILGVMVLVVSFSLMDGYRDGLEKTLRKIYPPLLLRSQGGMEIPEFIKKNAKIIKEDFLEGLAISKNENISKFVFLRAQEDKGEVVCGKTLADSLKIKEGDWVIVVFKRKNLQQMLNLKIDSIQKYGLSFVDDNYLSIPIDLLKDKNGSYGIYPYNNKNLIEIKKFLKKEPLWFSISFEEITKDIISALKVVEWSIGAILSLITFVSAFHLITKLLLDMRERKMTFAILYALGMRPNNIFFSFFVYSFILGMAGIFIGILSGILLVFIINSLHIFAFTGTLKGVYFVEEIVLKIMPQSIFFIFFLGISLILVLSIFIFFILKRIKILESLRFE